MKREALRGLFCPFGEQHPPLMKVGNREKAFQQGTGAGFKSCKVQSAPGPTMKVEDRRPAPLLPPDPEMEPNTVRCRYQMGFKVAHEMGLPRRPDRPGKVSAGLVGDVDITEARLLQQCPHLSLIRQNVPGHRGLGRMVPCQLMAA